MNYLAWIKKQEAARPETALLPGFWLARMIGAETSGDDEALAYAQAGYQRTLERYGIEK